jgi:putative MATE family efflux protein
MEATTDVTSGVAGATSRRQLARVIWALSWPVIATFAFESLVGLVDALMVGQLGDQELAAVGVGTQVFNAVNVVMVAVTTGTVALVARHIGAGERSAAEDTLRQSLLSVGALSLLTAAPVFWWAADVVRIFEVEDAVAALAAGYVRCMMLAVPSVATFYVIASGLRGAGDMRTPLAIGVLVNVVNVSACYVLIFGKLGLPALGVRGAGLASAGAFFIGAVAGLVWLRRPAASLHLHRGGAAFAWRTMWRVLAIGLPSAGEQLLMQIGFILYLTIAAGYGTAAVAAYYIGVRILALSFLPGFGFGAAASTLVGQNLGAGRPHEAERSGWEANRLAIILMSAGGLVIFLAARWIAEAFSDEPAVIKATVTFIRILAAAQPLMAADFTLGGALRGAGDTRFPLLAVMVGFYGARLGFAYVAASLLSLSLSWVWLALFGDYVARAALKSWRFRSGRWKHVRV